MISIKRLKQELEKFPEDAVLFAYEGEVRGLVIEHPLALNQGVIHCREADSENDENAEDSYLLEFED